MTKSIFDLLDGLDFVADTLCLIIMYYECKFNAFSLFYVRLAEKLFVLQGIFNIGQQINAFANQVL